MTAKMTLARPACAILALLAISGACHAATPAADAAAGPAPAATGTDTSAASRAHARAGGQQYQYQAEVNRLLDILIHSLYSNKDIFLRELISNASDALDKIRFLSLTDKGVLGEGETAELEIRIWLDKASNILFIRDRGIGMTRDDLVKNLGTIAKSGTSAFLEQMQKGGDINLIGQFGVGFYSVYLVADWVEVVTKHNDDKQYVWTSSADGSFSVAEDTDGEQLGRGTLIKIHLKPEAQEYADEAKLQGLVQRYSEFINFPIKLLVEKEVEIKDEDEGEEPEADKADDGEEKDTAESSDDAEDIEEDEEQQEDSGSKDAKPVKKEKRPVWEVLNQARPLWLRSPGDVSTEEYAAFYKAISKDYSDPLAWAHFKAEGDVEFRAILFIPKVAPYDFYDKYYEKHSAGPKLYVRRVFISDDVSELLPKYLSFLRGVVDSDTLPLNVSREMLQQHSSLKTIRKKLVRKVLDVIKKLADDEVKCNTLKESDDGRPSPDECKAFGTFWEQYGRAMKLGAMEDANNRSRLAKLLRFYTSASPDKLTSLQEYVSRMKDGQKPIYWVAGQNKEEVQASPFTEALVAKGFEVIYFTDVLDEYVMQHLTEFEDHKFANVAKDDVAVAADKATEKELKEAFKPLVKWWKGLLGSKVAGVKVSSRLASTPCVVVTGKYGSSANMERILRAQAFADPSRMAAMRGQRTLEINPTHPLIWALKEKVAESEADEAAVASAKLLYETALLESGYTPDDTKDFAAQLGRLVAQSLGVDEAALPSPPSTGDEAADGSKDEL